MNVIEWLICAVVVLVFALVISGEIKDTDKWEKFKTDNKCKAVAYIKGDVFNTVGISGSGNVSIGIGQTQYKTGWLCDDGVTYYR